MRICLNQQRLVNTEEIRGISMNHKENQLVIHLNKGERKTLKVHYQSPLKLTSVFNQIQACKLKRG